MPTKSLLAKPVEVMLNQAIAAELYASHLYKHLANRMQRAGFFGAQSFFKSESGDELVHYQILADFINDRGGVANIPDVDGCSSVKADTLRDALEAAYDAELSLEQDYTKWYKACPCVVTQQFLLQFLEIQRKAVGEYGDLLARLERCGTDAGAMIVFDKELGE